jgi:NADPH:quinone reductase-like Zn-dependent oxidoreductase
VIASARKFTADHGIDVVVDSLGPGSSGHLLMEPIYALRRGGKAINIGGVGEKTLMDIHWMMDQQIEFIGSNWFSTGDAVGLAEMARAGTLDLTGRSTGANRATEGSPTLWSSPKPPMRKRSTLWCNGAPTTPGLTQERQPRC